MSISPRVSVIVPNYNHEKFLERRLNSVLGQTFRDFELIFLDDASNDGSLMVFEKFQNDPRVRSLFNQSNSGSPFIQWNRGLEMARGEYVWIAESDDFCEDQFLEKLVKKLDDNPTAGLVYSQSWIVSEADEKIEVLDWYYVFGGGKRWAKDFVNSGKDELQRYLSIQNTIPNASAVLIRKAALCEFTAPEHMKICGDWLFWVDILLKSDIAFVAEPLNCFRQMSPTSQRKVTARLGLEVIESFEIQRRMLSTLKIEPVFKQRMFNHHLRRWASLSFHESLDHDYDRKVYQNFLTVYEEEGAASLADQIRVRAYFYLIIPAMKTWVYRKTIGRWRSAYLERKGVI